MEVANFHSALTLTPRIADSQWLTSHASKNFILVLPDGTRLHADVKVKDSSGLRSNDFIEITIWLNHNLIEHGKSNGKGGANDSEEERKNRPIAALLDSSHFPLVIQCQPPKPKYKNVKEEPDDNTPTMRASRHAIGQIDIEKLRQSTVEQLLATIWVQLYVMMSLLPGEEAFNVVLGQHQDELLDAAKVLMGAGLATKHPINFGGKDLNKNMVLCTRAAFWQTIYPFRQSPWLLGQASLTSGISCPASYIITRNVYHPQRPIKHTAADGPVYTRYILELGETLTFEVASSEDDAFVKKFTEWQNSDRVSAGWRQKGSEADQRQYLRDIEASDATIGLVGKWNGQPWGYIELYWAKESSIGPYYAAEDYDRGFHALVGEEHFRGPHRVRTWMGSVIHMLFLMDVRTQRVVLEPRASNHKMINYAQMCGGHVEKLIDLSHKRAALVICPREGFFQLCPLGPLTIGTATKKEERATTKV